MRIMLLGFAAGAAIAVPASPAPAQSFDADVKAQFSSGKPDHFQGCGVVDRRGPRSDSESRSGRRGGRVVCDVSVGTWVSGGEWALYNNRSWDSDSYNDWWHDRPDRAYPRWMTSNQDCGRQWWSGGGWRC